MRYRPEQHLRRQSDIRTTREQGRRIECGAFSLFWYRRPEISEEIPVLGPRVCTVASIAAVGKAIHRTLAKRRLRELFRRHQELLPASVDLMLIARSSCNRTDFKELEQRYLQACERIAKSCSKPQPPSGTVNAGA